MHTAVWVSEDDRAFATRLARYCARNPVALERLTYDRAAKAVTYCSDKSEGPTAGTETADPLEFLARVLVHVPDKGHVTTWYDGWYANRPRGMRRQAEPAAADTPPLIVPAPLLRRPRPPADGRPFCSQSVLARSGIAPYPRRRVDPPRLKFLSRPHSPRWRSTHSSTVCRSSHRLPDPPMNIKLLLAGGLLLLTACLATAPSPTPTPPSSAAATTSQVGYDEPHRPRFHFTPPAKWMNDPNGMVYYEGEYHLFYQYHPDSTVWGPMHWGHAVSRDLVQWEQLPIALYPDSLGLIFSGSAVVDWKNTSGFGVNGKPPLVAMFTYHDMAREKAGAATWQTQGIAYSNDRGRTWTKYTGNPVIPNPGLRDFRDTKVLWHEASQRWVMVLAAGDHIMIYSSYNLRDWQLASEFGVNLGAHGGVWECPDLFPLKIDGSGETKWVLLVSMNPGGPNGGSATQYFVGDFDGTTFTLDRSFAPSIGAAGKEPTRGVWVDHGRDNYAGVTWSDVPAEDGRRLFIGWMSNWDYATVVPTIAWRSAMTVPRVLSLHRTAAGPRLFSTPVNELRTLRTGTATMSRRRLSGVTELRLPAGASAAAAEVDLEFVVPPGASSDLALELTNAAGERYRVGYDAAARQFYSDRTATPKGFSPTFATAVHRAPRIATDSIVRMHFYVDRASVELFADGGATAMTDIVFPSQDFTSMRLVAGGTPVTLQYATVSGIRSIWR